MYENLMNNYELYVLLASLSFPISLFLAFLSFVLYSYQLVLLFYV